jgi:hypothetical protein
MDLRKEYEFEKELSTLRAKFLVTRWDMIGNAPKRIKDIDEFESEYVDIINSFLIEYRNLINESEYRKLVKEQLDELIDIVDASIGNGILTRFAESNFEMFGFDGDFVLNEQNEVVSSLDGRTIQDLADDPMPLTDDYLEEFLNPKYLGCYSALLNLHFLAKSGLRQLKSELKQGKKSAKRDEYTALPELKGIEDTTDKHKIILLHRLGVLEYLQEQCLKTKSNGVYDTELARVVSGFTGIDTATAKRVISGIFSSDKSVLTASALRKVKDTLTHLNDIIYNAK